MDPGLRREDGAIFYPLFSVAEGALPVNADLEYIRA